MISHQNHSDQELLSNYQNSHQSQAFEALFNRYQSLVYGTCLKYLKDRDGAQDAVMNIFEKLIEKLKTEDVKHFKSWLYMVTKNHCLMELRRSKKEIPADLMEIPLPTHPPSDKEELERDLTALEDCIETLKADQQTCVKLFYLEKQSYQQVSDHTTFDVKAVKSFIQNGKRNLKQCLESKNVSR